MTRLGKNKKRRWRHCSQGIEESLELAKKKQTISKQGFIVAKEKKQKNKTLHKGDKLAARDHPEFQTCPEPITASDSSSTITVRRPVKRTSPSKLPLSTDLWSSDSTTNNDPTQPASSSRQQQAVPLPGQSYNPSAVDHFSLLHDLGLVEQKLRARQAKVDRFMGQIRRGQPTIPQTVEAECFFAKLAQHESTDDLDKSLGLRQHQAGDGDSGAEENESLSNNKKGRNKKTKQDKISQKHELANIPKLLKELRREKQSKAERKLRLIERKKQKRLADRLESVAYDFQLPHELTSSLRTLQPEGSLLRDVESRRRLCGRGEIPQKTSSIRARGGRRVSGRPPNFQRHARSSV